MDKNSTVELAPESERNFTHVSWEAVRDSVDVRLGLLEEAQKVAGAEKAVNKLRDTVRLIGAARSPALKEELKGQLVDILASFGLELEGANDDVAVVPKIVDVQTKEQDYAPEIIPELTPEIIASPEASVSVDPVPEVVPAKNPELSLEAIKNGIERIKKEVGMQRFMETLKNSTREDRAYPKDKEYVEALKALGDLEETDPELRQKYSRFEDAAKQLLMSDSEVSQDVMNSNASVVVEKVASQPQSVPEQPPVAELDAAVDTKESTNPVVWDSSVEDVTVPVAPNLSNEILTATTRAVPQEVTPAAAAAHRDLYREDPTVSTESEMRTPESPVAYVQRNGRAQEAITVVDAEVLAETVPEETVPEEEPPIEVEEGLQDLLSKWPIFASSGLLGFGPNGIAHPVYKELMGLPMDVVVNGPLASVDPEIIQNIREYMEGWKQELGIEYDPQETFEKYLRRAISEKLRVLKEQTA